MIDFDHPDYADWLNSVALQAAGWELHATNADQLPEATSAAAVGEAATNALRELGERIDLHQNVVLSPAEREQLEAALDAPGVPNDALRDLLKRATVFIDEV